MLGRPESAETMVTPLSPVERVDLLVGGGKLLTMDASRRLIEDGAVAIADDTIRAVGTRAELESKYKADKFIDARGALILPGLINGHAHAPMSLFRGLADDLSLEDWLQKHIFPAEAANVNEEFVACGTRLSILEMLRAGITTYADMYYFEDVVARITRETGMRGILGETIVDFPAPDNKTPAQALEYTQRYIDNWKSDPLVIPAVAPHAIYTCSEKTLLDSAALARQNRVPILIHLSEAQFEAEQSRKNHLSTPVAYLAKIGFLGPDVVAAHCIWVDAADVAALVRFSVGCVHNPSSNMKLASGVMPVVDFLAAGVPIGLATDGAASNNSQDLLEEMDTAAKLQKIARMDPRALPAVQVVEMATIGGARALHLQKLIGSLEIGKKADLILVDTGGPHATPMYDVYSQLVYALRGSDVKTVIVAGKLLMENHRMLTIDEEKTLCEARAYQKKLAGWAKSS
jgi:5-methylthioadenosine/S-adenosylhomocysteine deaminase